MRTGLAVFADEVVSHQRRGTCCSDGGGTSTTRGQPDREEAVGESGMSRRRLELVVDPVACDGRGVCAEMLPERIELDRWGYPVIDVADISPGLVKHAVRAVRSCPKQALLLLERTC